MKRIVSVVAMTALAPVGAAAADVRQICAKGDDQRIIEIISPGEVGEICDVRYARADGAEASVPYHADNSPQFCELKAAGLAETLTEAGYQCVPASADAADAGANDKAQRRQTAEAPAQTLEGPNPGAAPRGSAQAPANAGAAGEPAGDAAVRESAALEARMRSFLAERPASAQTAAENAAVRGPAKLTSNAEIALAGGEQPSRVGRLVGAAPEDDPSLRSQPTMSVMSAGFAAAEPAPESAPEAAAAAAPPPAAGTAAKGDALRKPEDVIRATLQAQTAAWNEGNLDAFMETYWKSDDLKFVSGTEVTKGWSSTMKRYRERYADASGLGWLGFDKLEVTMATNDIAVVTGRFNHTKGDAATSGTFSLVMRLQNGVWRIVHDHTSLDPKPAQ